MPDLHQPPVPAGIHGVLSVLADAAEATSRLTEGSRLPAELDWLPLHDADLLGSDATDHRWVGSSLPRTRLQRLRAIDAVRPGIRSLRIGWLWVAGTTGEGEDRRRVFEPLVVAEVEVGPLGLLLVEEPRLTTLITDPHEQLRLESSIEWGGGAFNGVGAEASTLLLPRLTRLTTFARQAAAAAGIPISALVPAGGLVPVDAAPAAMAARPDRLVVVGLAVYATATRPDFSPTGSLRLWHHRVGTAWTAMHALYLDHPSPIVDPQPDPPSAYPLTVAQHACVASARTEAVTLISGAPGTGKSHAIAAIVGDAVARGESVLVATRAEPAVRAITELLAARPGPDPVVFGSAEVRGQLARRLAAGEPAPVPAAEVDRRRQVVRRAVADRDELWQLAADAIEGLALLDSPRGLALRQRMPGLRRPDVDLFEVQALLQRDRGPWWSPAARRRWARLRDLLGTAEDPDPEDLRLAGCLATGVARLHAAADPLGAGIPWRALAQAQVAVEQAAGEWVDAAARDERRLDRRVRAARAALATALRAGRAKRRALLAELGSGVVRALPVWVGTLGDIDDLLPMVPALFDLVVLDEASSIDQTRAATALLRGGRAVIVGDPHQLRHVSFVADRTVGDAMARHLPGYHPAMAAKLDVRQNSIFDVAAAVAPLRQLDEHFRSGAHLFAFVGRRLYGDVVKVATLTPATDAADLIGVTQLSAPRDAGKVVGAEVAWVLQRLAALRAEGVASVGVVTPFRAQADAIEAAVLDELGADGIEVLGLRVGTVHAFQGMERDVVLVSLGIGEGDGATTWRFADDPNLFAVMATRARRCIEWVVSAEPPAGSLIGDYLNQHARPPSPQRHVTAAADPWTRALAGRLDDVAVAAPYVSGRHRIDLCLVGDGAHLGVEVVPHPDGPHAHVRRHVELAGAGWPLVTALEAQWGDRPAELAVRLQQTLADLPQPG